MRALLRSDRADDELAKALARAGLYVERLDASGDDVEALREKMAAPDLAVVDPRLLAGGEAAPPKARTRQEPEGSFEELCSERLGMLLDRLGDQTMPDLYETVIAQVERALFQLALEKAGNLGAAAELLGIHRNTLSRKLSQLGLREAPARRRA